MCKMEGVIMAGSANLIKYMFLGFVILTGGIVSTADAVDWFVPTDFVDIQSAIDSPLVNPATFDTINVLGDPFNPQAHVYSGPGFRNVDFKGKNVTVRGVNGAGNFTIDTQTCIINCQQRGRAFIFQSGESVLARLQGFIIEDGNAADTPLTWPQDPSVDASGYGGAIYIKDSSPIIQYCVITDCNADSGGGAIFCDDNARPLISFCDIGLSPSSHNYAGVGFDKYIDPFDPNDVNQLDVNDLHQLGGGIYSRDSSPRIINCNIGWNFAAGAGGGIACENSDALIRNCYINDNYCRVNDDRIDQHGGGIYIKGGSPQIDGGEIIKNHARWSGGGIAVQDGNAVLIDNVDIIHNDCHASGGGIYSQGNPAGDPNADPNYPNVIIQNCRIVHNEGSWSGGVSSNYGSFADIDDCTIAWNFADWSDLVGGLETYYGDANVAGTIITNNSGVQMASAGVSASALGMEFGGLEMEIFGVNPGIDVSYCNIQMFDSGGFYDPTAVWPGEGNINKDPMFINPTSWPYNFHLRSGPEQWNISPCINAGNPFADYSLEPAPNGARINIGGYGGTDQAASSDILRPVPADADADLAVNLVDFAILANNWGLEGTSIQNKKADADNNNIVDGRDLLILHKFWLWLQ